MTKARMLVIAWVTLLATETRLRGEESKGMPWVSTSFGIGNSVLWGGSGGSQTIIVSSGFEFARPIRSFEYELSPTIGVPISWSSRGVSSGMMLGTSSALLFRRGSVKLGPSWENSLGFFTGTDVTSGLGLEIDFNGDCRPRSLLGLMKPSAKIMFEVEWEPSGRGVSTGWGLYAELKFCRR